MEHLNYVETLNKNNKTLNLNYLLVSVLILFLHRIKPFSLYTEHNSSASVNKKKMCLQALWRRKIQNIEGK